MFYCCSHTNCNETDGVKTKKSKTKQSPSPSFLSVSPFASLPFPSLPFSCFPFLLSSFCATDVTIFLAFFASSSVVPWHSLLTPLLLRTFVSFLFPSCEAFPLEACFILSFSPLCSFHSLPFPSSCHSDVHSRLHLSLSLHYC